MSVPTATPAAAIDAVNIAVGEVALALEPDDPRRAGLDLIQSGLDRLWAEAVAAGHRERTRVAA